MRACVHACVRAGRQAGGWAGGHARAHAARGAAPSLFFLGFPESLLGQCCLLKLLLQLSFLRLRALRGVWGGVAQCGVAWCGIARRGM